MREDPETVEAIEAELSSWSRTKGGGVRVGFLFHSDDVIRHKRTIDGMQPGRRYRVGFSEIGDDERPVRPDDSLAREARNLCLDDDFVSFLYEIHGSAINMPAAKVRELCGVERRADIKPGTIAADRWGRLKEQFRNWQHGM